MDFLINFFGQREWMEKTFDFFVKSPLWLPPVLVVTGFVFLFVDRKFFQRGSNVEIRGEKEDFKLNDPFLLQESKVRKIAELHRNGRLLHNQLFRIAKDASSEKKAHSEHVQSWYVSSCGVVESVYGVAARRLYEDYTLNFRYVSFETLFLSISGHLSTARFLDTRLAWLGTKLHEHVKEH